MGSAVIGFIGVLVGAFVTAFKEWLFKRRDQRRNAEYLAIRVCSMLDRFVDECVEVVDDDGTYRGETEPDGTVSPKAELADIGFDDLEVDWQALPAALSYRVLNFPNDVQRAKKAIEVAGEHASPPDYDEAFEARQTQYAKLGLRAAGLSDALRTFAGLPAREELEWDPLDAFRARLKAQENDISSRGEPVF